MKRGFFLKYFLENSKLKIAVNTIGAELSSVVMKETGRECIWQADPAVWAGQAPLLFPHCGSVKDDLLRVNGGEFPSPKHGFARHQTFEYAGTNGGTISFALSANAETKKAYPFDFKLMVEYTLEEDSLLQKVSVFNPETSEVDLPFSIGFHPAFVLPLGSGARTQDHVIEFSKPETPVIIQTPDGLVSGQTEVMFTDEKTIELADDMFAGDSICMAGLKSNSMSLKNKITGGRVTVGIEGFPFVLIWGPSKGSLRFICIEPWLSLPDKTSGHQDFYQKDNITIIKPGEVFSCTLSMQFAAR